MKRLLYLLLLLLPWFGYAQPTDATIASDITTDIRNKTYGAGRAADSFEDLLNSKVNRAETLVATGTDTYAVTGNSSLSYSNKIELWVLFTNANTTTSTLNVNGLGAKTIKKSVSTNLASGDILAGQIHHLVYDGTNFQLITAGGTGGGGGVSSVSGTTNRITSTGGATPVIDISASYVGQTSITTLGTIGTGTWNGSVIGSVYGGAGTVNGLLKANGSGTVSAATAGTDYLTPSGSGASLTGVWLAASGATLTGNNTITQAGFNTTFSGTGKVTFSPSATLAGFNWGSVASDPSGLSNGDTWYDATNTAFRGRQNGISNYFITVAGGTQVNRLLYGTTTPGVYTNSANLTFDGTSVKIGGDSQAPTLTSTSDATTANTISGKGLLITSANTLFGSAFQFNINNTFNSTSANQGSLKITNTFNPTSGTATYTGIRIANTINQTGGANGSIIGIDYDAIPTAVVGTHLAFRSTSGSVFFANSSSDALTANTRLDIRGTGTTTNLIQRWADSGNTTRMTLTDGGTLTLSNGSTHLWSGSTYSGWSTLTAAGGGGLIQVNGLAGVSGSLPVTFSGASSGGTALATNFIIREGNETFIGGTVSHTFLQIKGGFTRSSGTDTYNHTTFTPVYNTTSTYAGTAIGLNYDPTLTSVTGLTHLAFRSTSGNWAMQGSATTLTLGGGATASELRFLEPSGSGSNYTAFKAVAQGADIIYSLPPTVGAAGTVLTDVAGNGVLTWAAAGGGGGDVVGPASATDNYIARFNSGTGKLIQNSATYIDDDGLMVITKTTPTNNSIDIALAIAKETSGTAAVGIGTGIQYIIENGSGTPVIAAQESFTASNVTASSESFDYELGLRSSGSGPIPILGVLSTGRLRLNAYTTTTSFTGTPVGSLVFDASGNILTAAIGGGTTYYAPSTISADATNADYTAVVNTVKYLPAATLTANRTITMPAGTDGDVIELYNNEAGFSWLLAGSAVYKSDGVTTVTQLLANTNYLIRKVSGKWRILN